MKTSKSIYCRHLFSAVLVVFCACNANPKELIGKTPDQGDTEQAPQEQQQYWIPYDYTSAAEYYYCSDTTITFDAETHNGCATSAKYAIETIEWDQGSPNGLKVYIRSAYSSNQLLSIRYSSSSAPIINKDYSCRIEKHDDSYDLYLCTEDDPGTKVAWARLKADYQEMYPAVVSFVERDCGLGVDLKKPSCATTKTDSPSLTYNIGSVDFPMFYAGR